MLTLSLTSSYTETQTLGELSIQTGIQAGRIRAEQLAFTPTIAYRFDPFMIGTGSYNFTKIEQSGGPTNDAHTMNLGVDRRITAWDTGSLGCLFRSFRFTGDSLAGSETTTAHVFTLGWTRQITPTTHISLRAGHVFPRARWTPTCWRQLVIG